MQHIQNQQLNVLSKFASFIINNLSWTDHYPSPGCHCRRWPHLQAGECHRWRRWSHHPAAASQEGQHLPRSWWEQSTGTTAHQNSTFSLEWQCSKPQQFFLVYPFVTESRPTWSYLVFVFKEGSAKVLPACNWHKCVLDLVTMEQRLVKRQKHSAIIV